VNKLTSLLAVLTLCLLMGGGKTNAQTLEQINDSAAISPDGNFVAIPDLSQDLQEILILDRNLRTVKRLGLDWMQPASDGRLYRSARIMGSPIVWRSDATMLAAPYELLSGDFPAYETIVWNVNTGDVVLRRNNIRGKNSWSPSGQYLAIDNVILEVATGTMINAFEFLPSIHSVEWNPGNENELLLGVGGKALIVNPFTGLEIASIGNHYSDYPPSFNANGSRLAVIVGNDPDRVSIFDTTTYQQLTTVNYPIPTSLANFKFVGMDYIARVIVTEVNGDVIGQTNIRKIDSTHEIAINESILSWDQSGTHFLSRRDIDPQRPGRAIVSLMSFNGNTSTPFSLLAQVSSLPTVRTLSVGVFPCAAVP
jgi:hypothetical protein